MANIIKVPKRRANLTKLQSFVRLYFAERVFNELPQKGLIYRRFSCRYRVDLS